MNTLIAIIGLGILCLLFEIFNLRKFIIPATIVGLLGVLSLTFSEFYISESYYNNMIVTNKFSHAFSALFIVLTVFLIALSKDFYQQQDSKISDFIAIKIFLLSGAVAMVSFGNLAMFFLGIEVLSISLYILAASDRTNIKSNEAGMKYFLMGSFASGFLLLGICLIYGATGSFDVATISNITIAGNLPVWFPVGIACMVIGMLFKIAAVPFHFWAPDVYEGSPILTTALMSTLAKVVAIATLFKLLTMMNVHLTYAFQIVIVVISILSMTVGNLMALKQRNVKRMLAFSGISHAGIMLMSLLSLPSAAGSLLYYAIAYASAGIAAFAVILYVCKNKENENMANFYGLGKTNPTLAAVLTASLLSMAGIPVFAGFFAKIVLFGQTIEAGYLIVVIFAIINTVVSIGYYFKLVVVMFTKVANRETKHAVPALTYAVAIVAIVINVLLGMFPSVILDLLG